METSSSPDTDSQKMQRKPIDVLCVISRLRVGGVQTVLVNYAEPLLRHGIRLNFAVDTTEPQVHDAYVRSLGCRLFPITPYGVSRHRFMSDIRRVLRENPELKIVHSHLNYANFFSLLAASGLGRGRISHSHNSYAPSSLTNRILKALLRAATPLVADAYWGCSQPAVEWLFGRCLGRSRNSAVIINGIDTARFAFNPAARAEVRERLSIPSECYVWTHTGSFTPAKNHTFLLDLFAAYRRKHPDTHLILCGDGGLRPQIEEQIARLGIASAVTLAGNVPDCENYLSAGDIFILPSLFEGFSLSLIEAQCNGLPIVTTTAAVPPDAKLRNCTTIDGYDIDEWILAIEQAPRDIALRAEGRQVIEQSGFGIESLAGKLADLYRSVL